jgi:hypothetical protein
MAIESQPSNPGVQSPGQPGIPGHLTSMRQPGAQATRNIMRLLGQGFLEMGKELMKERPDPAAMARASAMIKQADQAKRGMIQSSQASQGTNLSPSTGRPRPVDGTIDPLTNSPSGGGAGVNPYGAELGR